LAREQRRTRTLLRQLTAGLLCFVLGLLAILILGRWWLWHGFLH
jgi:hypothetical protein